MPAQPEEASELMSRLDEVMDQEGNRVCAECPIQHPQWAVLDRGAICLHLSHQAACHSCAVPTGIFVCSLCAGVHREGVSKRVRSVAYDSSTWADEANVALMEKKGNAKHNALYASKTGKLPPPPSDPTYPQMREYIFEKYSFTPSVAAGSAGKQLAAAPTCGMLFVTAVSAAKLKNRDTGIGGDVSDPFLKVTLGDQVVKSSIVQDSLDPVWDQELDALKWDGMSLLQVCAPRGSCCALHAPPPSRDSARCAAGSPGL